MSLTAEQLSSQDTAPGALWVTNFANTCGDTGVSVMHLENWNNGLS